MTLNVYYSVFTCVSYQSVAEKSKVAVTNRNGMWHQETALNIDIASR